MAKKLNTDKPTGSKKPRGKSKKTAELVEKTEAKPSKPQVCQYCKHHDNHPSMCKTTGKYVARKCAACAEFKED